MRKSLSIIKQSCERAVAIVNDLLTVAREITAIMLVRLGYTLENVTSSEEAVSLTSKQAFGLVLPGMIIPGIEEQETSKQILAIRPDQKAILLINGFSASYAVQQAWRISYENHR